MRVILASASPRRQELLKHIFPQFTICPANTEEKAPPQMAAVDCPAYLAREKASHIAAQYPKDLVIGCDTAVILKDKMLGKPADAQDACRMLQALSGTTHQVVTGCCLIYGDGKETQKKMHIFSESTLVTFRNLTSEQIVAYIATGEPFDKAGAYGIQGKGGELVETVQGDFDNVVGLPVERLRQELAICGLLRYNFSRME